MTFADDKNEIHLCDGYGGANELALRRDLLPWSLRWGPKCPAEELRVSVGSQTPRAEPGLLPGPCVRVRPSPGPWGPRRPYFEGAVLGTQLLLELGDLAGRVLAQLGEAGLEIGRAHV